MLLRSWTMAANNATANSETAHVAHRLLRSLVEIEQIPLGDVFFSRLQAHILRFLDDCQGRRACRLATDLLTGRVLLNEIDWVHRQATPEVDNIADQLKDASTPFTRDLVVVSLVCSL